MIQAYINTNKNYTANGDMVLMPTQCALTAKLNGTWTVKLVHPIDTEGRWRYITDEAVIKMPSFNGDQLFRVYERKKSDKGVEAKLLPIFYDAAKEVFITDKRPTAMNGQQALNVLTEGTAYKADSNITTTETAYYIRKNLLECISGKDDNAFIKRWGGEAIYDNFRIILNARAGADNGVTVRYGLNMETNGFEEIVNLSGVITRVYPQGYNGAASSGPIDSPLINNYPNIRCGVREYPNIRMASDVTGEAKDGVIICYTKEELDAALRAAVEKDFEEGLDKPEVTIKAKMILLQNMEEYKDYKNLQSVSLGDTVHAFHTRLGITTALRVCELTFDAVTEKVSEVTLGDPVYSYFDSTQKQLNKMNNSIADASGSALAAAASANRAQRTADYTRAFFWYDDEGAHVTTVEGDATQGKNVLIDADGMAIRNGETELATFGESLIELGKGSNSAVISFINNLARMAYDGVANEFLIRTRASESGGPRILGLYADISPERIAAGHSAPYLALDTDYDADDNTRMIAMADHISIYAAKKDETDDSLVGYIAATAGYIQVSPHKSLFFYHPQRQTTEIYYRINAENNKTSVGIDTDVVKIGGNPIHPYAENTSITGIRLVRQGNIVVMMMNKSINLSGSTIISFGTIPAGYRPKTAAVIVAQYASGQTPVGSARVVIQTNGNTEIAGGHSGTYSVYCTACWVTDNAIS